MSVRRIAACAGLAFLVQTMPGSGAQAGQCGYDYCWGAVGVGPNGVFGYSFGQVSETEAYDVAMEGCGWACNLVRTFYNACGAIALASNGGWGWGTQMTRGAAENVALSQCALNGPNCRIQVWACSP